MDDFTLKSIDIAAKFNQWEYWVKDEKIIIKSQNHFFKFDNFTQLLDNIKSLVDFTEFLNVKSQKNHPF